MTNYNQLICPSTGEQCQYARYCIVAKAFQEAGKLFGGEAELYLEENVAAANAISYCSEERIKALRQLESDKATDHKIRSQAGERADYIQLARMQPQGETL